MVGSGAPGGGGSLKYFTPNIDIPALFDPKEFDCNKKTYLVFSGTVPGKTPPSPPPLMENAYNLFHFLVLP